MRVGVDASCWSNPRGYGRHARALLTALVNLDEVNSYTFFVDGEPSAGATDLPGRVDLNKLMPAAFTFLVLFVGLSLLLMAADITNPLRFPS